jgi:nucleoside-diphosphate-sugar epimerase
MNGRRIVLIGGAGFIGHNLALRLKAMGADVQVIDGLQVNNLVAITSNANNLPNQRLYLRMIQDRLHLLEQAQIPLHVQDARDYSALSAVLEAVKPQVIVQLAAVAHANRANKDPHSTFDHSLRTLENALDYSRSRIEHFIFLSSSMVYGNFAEGEVAEDTPCAPLGIYGALKFAGEKMVIAYNQVFDLPYTIVRPSALYGERCVSRRVGQVFIENALQGLDITVNGDGSDKLDFTYIGDLVNGLVKVIESERARGETFNLTYGQGRSINEMADILRSQFQNVNLVQKPRDRLMPERGTLSVEKARRLIGYAPQWPLDKGFVEYIKWYRHLFDSDASLRKAG